MTMSNDYVIPQISGFAFTHRWRFNRDIKLMLGFEPNWYFKITWNFLTPVALLVGFRMHSVNRQY